MFSFGSHSTLGEEDANVYPSAISRMREKLGEKNFRHPFCKQWAIKAAS